jgi:predicted helicase
MLNGNNLALVSSRQTPQENTTVITKDLIDFHFAYDSKLYPLKLFEGDKSTSNISQDFINLLKQQYKSIEITDEKAFYYVVGLLSSNVYFNKYKEQMRQDFPHVMLVKDAETFEKVAELGKKLSDEIADFDELKLPPNFSVQTNIEKIPDTKLQFTYDEKTKTLYLTRDKSLWIKGIEKEVFEFKQGNFNVIENWLKSRKGLDFDNEMLHSFNVVCYAVERYLQIRKELDKVLEGKI